MKAVESVVYKDRTLAVVVRAHALRELRSSGNKVSFATPEHFPLQVGIHARPKGDAVSAHFHRPFPGAEKSARPGVFFISNQEKSRLNYTMNAKMMQKCRK